ncbi:hypothetical protein K1W54_23905 [Micromonospora sp. CPCC 205371]|nr:hypothetical protein [Micromonospora sp. CPCC 205371]
MLLPVTVLVRRADEVEVVGSALAARAAGAGAGRIARALGRARSTVRGWLTRFAYRAELVRRLFGQARAGVAPARVLPVPAGSPRAEAAAATVAAGVAIARRWGWDVLTVSPWRVSCAVTGGRLLSPDRAGLPINTSPPWPSPL